MKKRTKIIITVAVALVLLLGIGGFSYAYPMMTMHPAPTGYVGGSAVYALNNGLNSLYFIQAEDGYIAVDAGSDSAGLEQALAESAIAPQDVRYVLLTHSDYDHVAGLTLFPEAEIYMSADELQMIDGTTRRNLFSSNSLPGDADTGRLILLADGQALTLGGISVECIAVPGHTTGSMAYLLDGAYLFTGDAFLVNNMVIGVHPFTMDSTAARQSIEKLKAQMSAADLVFTAHYGAYRPDELQ